MSLMIAGLECPLSAGVDEAGRGPLAGPVVASAVILDVNRPIPGLKDSKKLTPKRRDILFDEILEKAISVGIGFATPEEIDAINILQATFLAMRRAVEQLSVPPSKLWIDGNACPKLMLPMQAVVKGDDLIAEISAASIVAKVTRDRHMHALDAEYPGYGFAVHSGYPTPAHLAALQQLGASAVHRKSFGPVARVLKEYASFV